MTGSVVTESVVTGSLVTGSLVAGSEVLEVLVLVIPGSVVEPVAESEIESEIEPPVLVVEVGAGLSVVPGSPVNPDVVPSVVWASVTEPSPPPPPQAGVSRVVRRARDRGHTNYIDRHKNPLNAYMVARLHENLVTTDQHSSH